jgi:hypothetical protein
MAHSDHTPDGGEQPAPIDRRLELLEALLLAFDNGDLVAASRLRKTLYRCFDIFIRLPRYWSVGGDR